MAGIGYPCSFIVDTRNPFMRHILIPNLLLLLFHSNLSSITICVYYSLDRTISSKLIAELLVISKKETVSEWNCLFC